MKKCCSSNSSYEANFSCEKEGGRIVTKLPRECLDGTTVFVYGGKVYVGKIPVWEGTVNKKGVFDTGCILPCPATYTVIAKNEKCEFSPESIMVEVPCCPKYATVEFKCDCDKEKKKGRIDISLPTSCTKGTKINIIDAKKNVIKVLEKHSDGVYSTGCTLPCPGTYYVKPINSSYTFSPEIQTVNIRECCPKFNKIAFKCTRKRKTLFTDSLSLISYLLMNFLLF